MKTKENKNKKDLVSILNSLNNRVTAMELYLKMLDSTILRFASAVEILVEKKIISKEDIIKKSKELMELDSELQEKLRENLLDTLDSEDIGHA